MEVKIAPRTLASCCVDGEALHLLHLLPRTSVSHLLLHPLPRTSVSHLLLHLLPRTSVSQPQFPTPYTLQAARHTLNSSKRDQLHAVVATDGEEVAVEVDEHAVASRVLEVCDGVGISRSLARIPINDIHVWDLGFRVQDRFRLGGCLLTGMPRKGGGRV